MQIHLVEHAATNDRWRVPEHFNERGIGFRDDWWAGSIARSAESRLYSAYVGDDEVARALLRPSGNFEYYEGIPQGFDERATTIQYVEVRNGWRDQGVARRVVELLCDRQGGQPLVAFSTESAGFWRSLGWSHHLHEEPMERRFHDELFVWPPLRLAR